MTQILTFDRFGPEHLDAALRLSQEAGWPHRRDDWALVASVSDGLVGLQDGQVVATAMATPFGAVSMANMIIVDQKMRGQGLGRGIMTRVLELTSASAWRLVATQAGLPLYRKLGFEECGLVHQHQGRVAALPAPDGVRLGSLSDLPEIRAMDAAATAADRSRLLAELLRHGTVALVEGKGFAISRDFGRGRVVGPVIADDAETARQLLAFLIAGHEGEFIRVDTPDDPGLSDWLAGLGLLRVDTGVAMQRGETHPLTGTFSRHALAAQALG
ncbi:GNAT family N-acetyltransferase [Paracoccus sp. MBLB3053]|uniref:GNAT family N-acetyltransferase n=1 Tax=Paracoccus aurantius TaxID=3073814 RepID=A0ABU2HXZ1_9RHOB|nr:GNAT family N-acetyltransferase [Paracoccus sp. MBLB3053]MDS9469932.1 GNAT family N-acetyltransferase [Paracoccus sp. MBLB3053]